jgi:hypothetical protein
LFPHKIIRFLIPCITFTRYHWRLFLSLHNPPNLITSQVFRLHLLLCLTHLTIHLLEREREFGKKIRFNCVNNQFITHRSILNEREREATNQPNLFQPIPDLEFQTRMKREGKHHGNAKSHPNKTARYIEKLPSASIETHADQLQLLHPKPTNGSRFTGKCKKPRCKSCHYHPVTKSKDKTKGSYKLKSCDVALNHRLVSWRVVGDDSGILDYKGVSASAVLKDLAGSIYSSNYSCDEANEFHDRAPEVGYDVNISYGYEGGSVNNSIDNSNDLIEFGGLFDEDETVQQRNSANYNSIDNSSEFIEFGNLFDETEKESTSDLIGFGCLFDEIEIEDELGVAEEHSGMISETEKEGGEGDDMGFYIVGVAYEYSDGEDWLVVDEM